jgi:hypothetical protein
MRTTAKASILMAAATLVAITFLHLTLSSTVNAGVWDMLSTSSWDTKDTTHYLIEVEGFDARVYEWTPANNPNMSCVFVASNVSSGVACYSTVTK